MKKGKKLFKKRLFSFFIVAAVMFQIFAPTMVIADGVFEDASTITLTGNPTINGNVFEYDHGDVTVTKNGVAVNTLSFEVNVSDVIEISLLPDDTYRPQLHNNNQDYNVTLSSENKYSFTIGRNNGTALSLTPSFSNVSENPDPEFSALKFNFTINGESFTNVSIGDELAVPATFNMDTITEFYVTRIWDGEMDLSYAPGEYSYNMLDNENKKIFEVHYNKISDKYASFRVEAHSDDILPTDIAAGKSLSDYFAFYITGLKFVKEGFKGVEISTGVMPDNYDFTVWNGADLSSTSLNNPGIVSAYYGSNTISLSSSISSGIANIELANNTVPSSAININNETGDITILSNYYNEIPLKITLEDGTVGYITINRIGIFISDLNVGQKTLYHGGFASVGENLNVDTDKNRIVAVFYHEDETTYDDYDLIVNLTYSDGTTETKMAQGVGDVHNSSGNIIGSDYILWKGAPGTNAPTKVSVTAVKKGATSNSDRFGGATFGSGSGVTWVNN